MLASKMSMLNFSAKKDELIAGINGFPFTELTGYTAETAGFIAPWSESDECAVAMDDLVVFRLRIDQKKVPSSAVRSELDKKCKKYENENGHKPDRKTKKQMKEDITDALIAKAIAQETVVDGWLDFSDNLLVITDTSASRIDLVLSLLMKNCPSLQLNPVATNTDPAVAMTQWVSTGEHPDWMTIDDQAKFAFPNGGKASLSSVNLTDERVTNLLSMDAQVVELAVTVDDRISVVMTDKLCLKKVGYVELDTSDVDEADLFRTYYFLNAETARDLREKLVSTLGGQVN